MEEKNFSKSRNDKKLLSLKNGNRREINTGRREQRNILALGKIIRSTFLVRGFRATFTRVALSFSQRRSFKNVPCRKPGLLPSRAIVEKRRTKCALEITKESVGAMGNVGSAVKLPYNFCPFRTRLREETQSGIPGVSQSRFLVRSRAISLSLSLSLSLYRVRAIRD